MVDQKHYVSYAQRSFTMATADDAGLTAVLVVGLVASVVRDVSVTVGTVDEARGGQALAPRRAPVAGNRPAVKDQSKPGGHGKRCDLRGASFRWPPFRYSACAGPPSFHRRRGLRDRVEQAGSCREGRGGGCVAPQDHGASRLQVGDNRIADGVMALWCRLQTRDVCGYHPASTGVLDRTRAITVVAQGRVGSGRAAVQDRASVNR